ncbi:isopentenyl transferase IPT7 [Panicum miliaceum]|uniref:Isopentenyl transferase IPT7 n=1 Tax=Panicum miliaceum TaxID=4540 RepID=A0A3L6R214_PANMI|nr:isopentenyl transferase IPT7 [Panicum miliaceum]
MLAVDLALRFGGEVINSDKIQVHEGLDVVTNKVTTVERKGVPHRLLQGHHVALSSPSSRGAASRSSPAAPIDAYRRWWTASRASAGASSVASSDDLPVLYHYIWDHVDGML